MTGESEFVRYRRAVDLTRRGLGWEDICAEVDISRALAWTHHLYHPRSARRAWTRPAVELLHQRAGGLREMPRRAEFSEKTKRQALERANGKCDCCGHPYKGRPEFDHIVPAWVGGDNSLENCAVLDKSCDRRKTSGKDVPEIARSKRLEEKRLGLRTKRRGFRKPPPGYDPWTRSMRKDD